MTAKAVWYLAQTKPNGHRLAQRNLLRQKFEIFLPLQSETKARGNRFVVLQKPLFPGYLFVKMNDSASQMRQINGTLGICRVVSFGTTPARIPVELVAGLQQRCDDAGIIQPANRPQKGVHVKITSGPFSDFIAVVDSLEADRRIWVLADILGQKIRIQTTDASLTEV